MYIDKPLIGSLIDWTDPGALGLQVDYPTNTGSGDRLVDHSLNRRNAVINGSTWSTGERGDVLDHDGSTDQSQISDVSFMEDKMAMTISIYLEADTLKLQGAVFTRAASNATNGIFLFNNGTISYFCNDAESEDTNFAVTVSPDLYNTAEGIRIVGAWRSGSKIELYINGILVAETVGVVSLNIKHDNFFFIGFDESNPARHLDGRSDAVTIHDEYLTDQMVMQGHIDSFSRYDIDSNLPIYANVVSVGGLSRYHNLDGLGGQGTMTKNPLG